MKQQIIPRKAIKLPEVRRVQGAQDRQNRQDTQSTQSTQRTQGAHAVQSAQSTQNEQGRQRTQGAHGVQGVLDRQNRQDTQSAQKTQDAQDQQSTQDTQGASSRKRTALSKTTLQALAIPALLVLILYGAMRSGALPHIHAFAPGAPDTPGKSGSSLNAPANSSQQPQDTSIRSEPLNAQGEPAD